VSIFSDDGEHLDLPPAAISGELHQEIEVAARRWLGPDITIDAPSATGMLLNYPDGGHHYFSTAELLFETRARGASSRREQIRVFISELPADADEARQRTNTANLSIAVVPAGRFDGLGSYSRGKISILRAHPMLDAVLSVRLQDGGESPMTRSSLRDSLGDLPEPELWDHALANIREAALIELFRTDPASGRDLCGWYRPLEDADLGLAGLLLCPDLICQALRGQVRPPYAAWLMTAGPLFFSAQPGARLDARLSSGLSTVASDPDLFLLPWPLTVSSLGELGAGVPEAETIMDQLWGPGFRLATAEGLTFQTKL
jgi:hypothetical protein